eukprot:8528538-Karenia_brevis.AAC.1
MATGGATGLPNSPVPSEVGWVGEGGEVGLNTSFDRIYESNMVAEPASGAVAASSTQLGEASTGVVATAPEVQTVEYEER